MATTTCPWKTSSSSKRFTSADAEPTSVSAPSALPQFAEWAAPASWEVVDFISDLHLSDDTPRGFEAWSAYLSSTPADAVVILGDLFEVWVGDDSRVAGFEARCAAVLGGPREGLRQPRPLRGSGKLAEPHFLERLRGQAPSR